MKSVLAILFILAFSASIATAAPPQAAPPQYIQAPPMDRVVTAPVGEVKSGGPTNVFLITWGGDMATIYANGNSLNTAKGSIFANQGLNIKLSREDDFQKQVEMYIRGETPYLRGTIGMINLAAELLSRDPRTKPVVIYQMTWSNGGDTIVVKSGIKTLKDLCGKTIALQAYGPHVDYMSRVVTDACGSVDKINIKWTKDLVGMEGNTPGAAFRNDPQVSAAFVISPDAAAISGGVDNVGTGAEYSVKGARTPFSTKTANRIIADVYVVRSDYLQKNRAEVEKFTHGLMIAEESLRDVFKNKTSQAALYKAATEASAEILFGSKQAVADVEGLYADAEFVGYKGNVKFFGDPNYPRNLEKLTNEIQSAYITLKILSKKVALEHARWDYKTLAAGLRDVQGVEAPKFVKTEVEKVVVQKQQQGKLGEGELFSLEIKFQPNQNVFSVDKYEKEFDRVINLVSTYGGAVLTVEGHADPTGYLRAKKQGISDVSSSPNVPGLKDIRQSAKNLSYTRAAAVRDSVIAYAKSKSVKLDASQFVIMGHGFENPKSGMCGIDPCYPKTEQEWQNNMRVEFHIIQIEVETSVFRPLD